MLFFLAKQGELAKLLLDAKQGVGEASYHAAAASGGGGESTALMRAEDEEEARGGREGGGGGYQALSLTVAAGGGGKDRYSIYCAVGREIAELMRFLQLNGELFRSKRAAWRLLMWSVVAVVFLSS